MRVRGYRRVSHGLFLKVVDRADEREELLRDLRAWLLVLPPGAVFTHVTGARLRGWHLPTLPEQVPVFAAVEDDVGRPRRPGLICSRLRRGSRPDVVEGLPVEAPEEILLRAARDLGLLDLSILVESALRRGDVDRERMDALLSCTRPGVRLLRAAWERASALADSPGETVLRLFHDAMDVPTTPQARLTDADGRLVGIADLLVDGTGFVHEYDGAVHRDPVQHRKDLRRERGWAGTDYVRRGFTLDDLLRHPAVVMHELDRALDRRHVAGRLERWRRLVTESLYAEPGRRRVLNRWNRAMGTTDWARTTPRGA